MQYAYWNILSNKLIYWVTVWLTAIYWPDIQKYTYIIYIIYILYVIVKYDVKFRILDYLWVYFHIFGKVTKDTKDKNV